MVSICTTYINILLPLSLFLLMLALQLLHSTSNFSHLCTPLLDSYISLFLPPDSSHPLSPFATSVLLLISNVAGTPIPCCMWKLNKRLSAYWRYTGALIKMVSLTWLKNNCMVFEQPRRSSTVASESVKFLPGRPRCVFQRRFHLVGKHSHHAVCWT